MQAQRRSEFTCNARPCSGNGLPAVSTIWRILRPPRLAAQPAADTHYRVRRDRVDPSGVITIRYNSRLLHIGLGRQHAGVRVLALIADLRIRVINADTGELLRDLTLDPSWDYQPRGLPPGPQPQSTRPKQP